MSTASQAVIDRLNILLNILKEKNSFGNSTRNNFGPILRVAMVEINSNKVTKSSFYEHKFKVYIYCPASQDFS